jgi:Gram-negative bacterial TonB protein C-terminal
MHVMPRRGTDVLRAFGVFIFCTVALVAVCRASAMAATEFCPATLTDIATKSSSGGATTYYYRLQALRERAVEGTIIADTDAGWFTWSPGAPVQLARTTFTTVSSAVKYSFRMAESAELTVIFPQPVSVRHAWITTAQTHGDRFFNWDAQGAVACEPPAYLAPSKYRNTATTTRTPQAGDETPAPAPAPAKAVASAAPFRLGTCAQPFVNATVTHAVQPNFPELLRNQGFSRVTIAIIAIAVDPQGKLVDAWVWATSGYPAIDEAALKAAQQSSYSGATSYCRPVSGTYLFRADFTRD